RTSREYRSGTPPAELDEQAAMAGPALRLPGSGELDDCSGARRQLEANRPVGRAEPWRTRAGPTNGKHHCWFATGGAQRERGLGLAGVQRHGQPPIILAA